MYNRDENKEGEGGGHGACMCQRLASPGFKEFKLAKLEKKAKMLQAELEFINKIKELVSKMPESADK